MGIKRCFFWQQNQKLACVWYKGSELVLLNPKGQVFADKSADYWQKWAGYTGFLPEQEEVDFCLVYEEEIHLPKNLEACMNIPKHNFWNEDHLKECMKIIGIGGEVELLSPEGNPVTKLRLTMTGQTCKRFIRIRPDQNKPENNDAADKELKAFTAYYLSQADKKHKTNI